MSHLAFLKLNPDTHWVDRVWEHITAWAGYAPAISNLKIVGSESEYVVESVADGAETSKVVLDREVISMLRHTDKETAKGYISGIQKILSSKQGHVFEISVYSGIESCSIRVKYVGKKFDRQHVSTTSSVVSESLQPQPPSQVAAITLGSRPSGRTTSRSSEPSAPSSSSALSDKPE